MKAKKTHRIVSQNTITQIDIWSILSQKPMHVLVKLIAENCQLPYTKEEKSEYYVYSFKNESCNLFLLKNTNIDFLKEQVFDYLLILTHSSIDEAKKKEIINKIKKNENILGLYNIKLNKKITQKLFEVLY
ncbi:MAG: hypothetical protein HPY79_10190 [Bacteroidales bacterium]|nr:hypothetical protein [Bacteroidales bacterium]